MTKEITCRSVAVLIASYTILLILSFDSYGYGVLYMEFLERFKEGEAKTSLIGSLHAGLTLLLGPLASVLVNLRSCRWTLVMGGCISSLVYFVCGFIHSVDLLIAVLGIGGGIANALMVTPSMIALGFNFTKYRNTVMSFALAAVGISIFVASPILLAFLDAYSLSGTFLMISAINMHVIVSGLVCKPSTLEIEHKHTLNLSNYHKNIMNTTKHGTKLTKVEQVISLLRTSLNVKLLKKPSFLLFIFSTSTWNFVLMVTIMHVPNHIVSTGGTKSQITAILGVFSLCNLAGRTLGAISITKVNNLLGHNTALAACGLLLVTFPAYKQWDFSNFILAGGVGFLVGIPNSYMTAIALQLTGIENLSSSQGFIFFSCGIGFVIGPPVAGLAFELSETYDASFIIAGSVSIVGCGLGILSSFMQQERRDILHKSITLNSTSCDGNVNSEGLNLIEGKQSSKETDEQLSDNKKTTEDSANEKLLSNSGV